MREVVCTAGPVLVTAGSYHRVIVVDDVVDLDQVLVPAQPESKAAAARPAVTLADALGHHVAEAFTPVADLNPALASVIEPGALTGPLGADVQPISGDKE